MFLILKTLMKELNHTDAKAMVEMSVGFEKQEEKKNKMIGSILPGDGHIIWKIDVNTLRIEPINDDDLMKDINFDETPNKRIMMQDGFLYCAALNKKNAIKRFGKMFEHLYGKELIRTEKKNQAEEGC
jgi:hypothetical protein